MNTSSPYPRSDFPFTPPANLGGDLLKAIDAEDFDEVKRLTPLVDHNSPEFVEALAQAAWRDQMNTVQFLLPLSDPRADNSKALRMAVLYGNEDIVRLLLPLSDPAANQSEALEMAAQHGHLEIAEWLIPVSDPKADHSKALWRAAQELNEPMIQLLMPVSDPEAVLKPLHAAQNWTQADSLFPYVPESQFLKMAELFLQNPEAIRAMPRAQERLLTLQLRDVLTQTMEAGSDRPKHRL